MSILRNITSDHFLIMLNNFKLCSYRILCCVNILGDNISVHNIQSNELTYKSDIYFNNSNIIEIHQKQKLIITVPPSCIWGWGKGSG